MYKLGLEKAEETEIKLATFAGSWRKQGNSKKTSTSSLLTTLKPLAVWITTNRKILKEMGLPEHLTCLQRNLDMDQEATVRIRHEQLTANWERSMQIGCILSLYLFNFYAECIMRNARLDKAQAGIKVAWRNINNLRYADDTTVMAESEEELKSLLMRVKEKREKSWLKTQYSKN